MEKLHMLFQKHRKIILYVVFGGMTTLVNYAVYLPLLNFTPLSATLSNVIAWFASVVFAFLTNKPFVFQSHDWSLSVVFLELLKFFGTRIGSGLLETVFLMITVDMLQWDGNWMKILICVVVIIVNYIGSRLSFIHKK